MVRLGLLNKRPAYRKYKDNIVIFNVNNSNPSQRLDPAKSHSIQLGCVLVWFLRMRSPTFRTYATGVKCFGAIFVVPYCQMR